MIALITDFGNSDNYVGVVKGVLKKHSPEAEIIDITHGVKSFSITNAQYMLSTAIDHFPDFTIFFVIVDPGVGSDRKALVGCRENMYVVAPDNGIISSVMGDGDDVFAIKRDYFGDASSTFHGRDVFAPAAALLARGVLPIQFGEKIKDWIRKPFPEYHVRNEVIEGVIIHIDKFGNVVTSIPNDCIGNAREVVCKFEISGKSFKAVVSRNYCELDNEVPGIIHGSSGFIEIAMNMASLADLFSIKIDERISVMV